MALGPPSTAAANVGPNLAVGDRVFGLAHGCLGTLASGPACMMAPMPPGMSMQVRLMRGFTVPPLTP
jgi:hypothetical protein